MEASAGKRIAAALVLCALLAFVAGLLLLQHYGEPRAVAAVSQACGEGESSGCDQVAQSGWSRVGGFPVAAWGLAFYLSLGVLLLLALVAPAELRPALALVALGALAAALVADLALLAVQAFAIHAFCKLCILTYALGAVAFAALLPARRAAGAAGALLARPEGRIALAGAVAGALAILAFVFAANTTLRTRAAARSAGLLGAPAPAPVAPASDTPPPAAAAAATPTAELAPAGTSAPAGGVKDAAYWREQAQKLQATLDDPRKLEEYFSAKAQRDHDAAPIAQIDLANAPMRGPAEAPVTVVEYSDFLCPYCRQLAQALAGFVPQAGGRIKIYFKNYPLEASCNPKLQRSIHTGSCALALGGLCAQYQGKFEAYHDRVFGTEMHSAQPADVIRLAGEAGLNASAMEGCLDDPKTKAALAAQVAEGNRLGITSTPTVYIDGKKLPQINYFVAVVDKEAR
ncbi:MAG TPA: thioredoxin domain-containing protein, partial [Vicinamibacteria bacterium]